MSETEQLRQMVLNIAVRVGVLETSAETLLVLQGRQLGSAGLKGVLNWMTQAHKSKPLEEGSQPLAQWLRNEELKRLQVLCENVAKGVAEVEQLFSGGGSTH